MTFERYIIRWFQELVDDHELDDEWIDSMFDSIGGSDEYLEDGETHLSYLQDIEDDERIWDELYGSYSEGMSFIELPSKQQFLQGMFANVGSKITSKYDFASEIFKEMAVYCADYSNPLYFFQNLQDSDYPTDMFMLADKCYEFYIHHIDEIEDFKATLKKTKWRKEDNISYCQFICNLCYRNLAHKIAKSLWPDEF